MGPEAVFPDRLRPWAAEKKPALQRGTGEDSFGKRGSQTSAKMARWPEWEGVQQLPRGGKDGEEIY